MRGRAIPIRVPEHAAGALAVTCWTLSQRWKAARFAMRRSNFRNGLLSRLNCRRRRRQCTPQDVPPTTGTSCPVESSTGDRGNKPLPFTLKGIDYSHPYLGERGITEETAKHFGIGFFPGKGCMQGRIVIPIHSEEGILVAYAGRVLAQSEPKYKFPPLFQKSLVLFN